MQLIQNLRTYPAIRAPSKSFDGRNCTADEIFSIFHRIFSIFPRKRLNRRKNPQKQRIAPYLVEKYQGSASRNRGFQNGTIRVCSGPINSYAMPRQRILRVTREFTKFTMYRNGTQTVNRMYIQACRMIWDRPAGRASVTPMSRMALRIDESRTGRKVSVAM